MRMQLQQVPLGSRRSVVAPNVGRPLRGRLIVNAVSTMPRGKESFSPPPPKSKTWQGTWSSSAPIGEENTELYTEFQIVTKKGDVSEVISLVKSGWGITPRRDNDLSQGWITAGDIQVPEDLVDPAALRIRKLPLPDGCPALIYISEIVIHTKEKNVVFPVHSWVSSDHGVRTFFETTAYLPDRTPQALKEPRKQELAALRCDDGQERKGAERKYGYQVYNDLGKPNQYRPALGGSRALPYPRRLATNRPLDAKGQETAPVKCKTNPGGVPWLPFDEKFNFTKEQGFKGDSLAIAIPAFVQYLHALEPWKLVVSIAYTAIRQLPLMKYILPDMRFPPVENFQSIRDVLQLFSKNGTVTDFMPKSLYPEGTAQGLAPATTSNTIRKFKDADGNWNFYLDDETSQMVHDNLTQRLVGDEVYKSATSQPTLAAAAKAGSPVSYPILAEVDKDGQIIDQAVPEVAAVAAAAAADIIATDADASMTRKQIQQEADEHGALPPSPGARDIALRIGVKIWNRIKETAGKPDEQLTDFPVPKSLAGRPEAWTLDEEMGRQALAGMHPCSLAALKVLPSTLGSCIEEKHLADELQGATLQQLVNDAAAGKKPRLFIMDYWDLSYFWGQMEPNSELVQHAGRAVFYLRKKPNGEDEALIPIAIELAHPKTHKQHPDLPMKGGIVYTRKAATDPEAVIWRLAKAVFRSLDSSYHQLISHWLRTHACMEPMLIAMRRQMSFMHPVFKLMLPHFRYTLQINANARSSLVNAGGIIEENFSAGEFAMRLSSVVYGSWKFSEQSLPNNLKARGMVDADGKPWMEYPYATDGLDLWVEMETYFTKYLGLYYDSDAAVVNDVELQAWWKEVKEVGHGDLLNFGFTSEAACWGFEGPITTRAQLVQILVTIGWTASAHHAAVNFGQYDFSSLLLNFSSMVRKPMPAPGDKAYEELVSAIPGAPQEAKFLQYLADVIAAVSVMSTVRLLSSHADDEQTLDKPNGYLKDPAAAALNKDFVQRMAALEARINTRNNDPKSWTRNQNDMGYTLLIPSSGPGVTNRGVPYSVSI